MKIRQKSRLKYLTRRNRFQIQFHRFLFFFSFNVAAMMISKCCIRQMVNDVLHQTGPSRKLNPRFLTTTFMNVDPAHNSRFERGDVNV